MYPLWGWLKSRRCKTSGLCDRFVSIEDFGESKVVRLKVLICFNEHEMSTNCSRVRDEVDFHVQGGVRQGCVLSRQAHNGILALDIAFGS